MLKGFCWFENGWFVQVVLLFFVVFEFLEMLDVNWVMCIVEDVAGQFWLGMDGSGLYYYDGNIFINYIIVDGLVGNFIFSIVLDEKGGFWLGMMFNGVSYYVEGKI